MRTKVKLIIDNNDPDYARIYQFEGSQRPHLAAVLHTDSFTDLFGRESWRELVQRQPCTCEMTLEWVEA